MSMTDEETLKSKIDELEKRKGGLIDRIKQLNRRIRYKEYEEKALRPFLEQTKHIQIAPFRRQRRALEFKIATAAYTPKIEKDLIKKLDKIDEELAKHKEVERARRKIKYVEQDLTEGKAEISNIEVDLTSIRGELRTLYDEMKTYRISARKEAAANARAEEDLVALGDIALIEKE
jgi:uncharacterized coiled-coil DUF342 family protein